MEYKLDSRFKRTDDQKLKKERGTEVPIIATVFGDEEGDRGKMLALDLTAYVNKILEAKNIGEVPKKVFLPASDLVKVILAEDLL